MVMRRKGSDISTARDFSVVKPAWKRVAAAAFVIAVSSQGVGALAQTAVENLDLSAQQRQQITGWGLFTYSHRTAWGSYYDLRNSALGVTAVADQMFSLGINTLRLELPAEAYDSATGGIRQSAIDDIADAVVRARTYNSPGSARTRDVDYLLTVWSTPREMKVACRLTVQANGQPGEPTDECYPDNGFESGRLQIREDGAYAVYGGSRLNPQPDGAAGLPPGFYFSATVHGAHDRSEAATGYLLSVLTALRTSSAGLPYAISLQNEPGHLPDYDGTFYAAANYKNAVKKLKQALLATRGTSNDLSSVRVVFGDVNSANDLAGQQMNLGYGFENYYGAHGGLDAVHTYTDVLAFHTYDQFQPDDVRLINQRDSSNLLWSMAANPDPALRKPVWMTEWSIESLGYPGTQPIDGAIYELGHMLRDLRVFPIERYVWWRAWSYAYGERSGDLLMSNYGDDPNLVTWQPRKIFHVLKRLWNEVPGNGGYSVRPLQYAAGSTGDLSVSGEPTRFTTHGLAFRNDTRTVLVVINPDPSMQKSVTVNGVGGASAMHYSTDGRADDQVASSAPQVSASGSVQFNTAPRSINIVVVDAAGGSGGGTGGGGSGGDGASCTPIQYSGGNTTISVPQNGTGSTSIRMSTDVASLSNSDSSLPSGEGSVAIQSSGRRISITVDLRGASVVAGDKVWYQVDARSADCSEPQRITGTIEVGTEGGKRRGR